MYTKNNMRNEYETSTYAHSCLRYICMYKQTNIGWVAAMSLEPHSSIGPDPLRAARAVFLS